MTTYPSLKNAIFRIFFWVPFFLALIDLVFYATIPVAIIFLMEGGAQDFLSSYFSGISVFFGATNQQFAIILIVIVALSRIFLTRLLESIFSRSLSNYYSLLSVSIIKIYFRRSLDLSSIDISNFRKAINSELNNFTIGYLVPISLALAEILLLVIMFFLAFSFLGDKFLIVSVLGLVILAIPFYFVRARSHFVGILRMSSEKERLRLVEVSMKNAFAIGINGGVHWLFKTLKYWSRNFSLALAKQVVLPYTTKSIIEAALILFAVIIFLFVDIEVGSIELAFLGGLALRAFPSISRLSSYTEAFRVNKVSVNELKNFIDGFDEDVKVPPNLQLLDRLDRFLKTGGVLVVTGSTGSGKSTTLKQWARSIMDSNSVAFMDQSALVTDIDVNEFASLCGLVGSLESEAVSLFTSEGRSEVHLGSVSGGQSKFLQFSVLKGKKVDVLILDEPNVGLDSDLREVMASQINKVAEYAAVVVVSHDVPFIELLEKKVRNLSLYSIDPDK